MTFRETANALCKEMPGATWSEPFGPGHDVWKIGDKMFAAMGAVTPGISVKCPDVETATMLKDAGVGTKAPYFHVSWILLPETTALDELKHRIAVSYDTIRAGLTKKAQAALPIREEAI